MMHDLFANETSGEHEQIGPAAWVLRGFALDMAEALLSCIHTLQQQSPFRHMTTPGGFTMSVALTNCGRFGWVSDESGYRYSETDPLSGQAWPAMPELFTGLASKAAAQAGFGHFQPDACLINRYLPGAKLSMHQDKDEKDFSAPIVSVSMGMPALFLFGGLKRSDKANRIPLLHGDVVVWGGPDRLRYHGILPLKDKPHPLLGSERINFTFRKAG